MAEEKTKIVMMLTPISGTNVTAATGQIVEIPENDANNLLDEGLALPVSKRDKDVFEKLEERSGLKFRAG